MPNLTRTDGRWWHISLNPHPDDRLSDVEYTELAREYMERMGFGRYAYMVYKHMDLDTPPIYISLALRSIPTEDVVRPKITSTRSKDISADLDKEITICAYSERQKITRICR